MEHYMTHVEFFEQAIRLASAQLGTREIPTTGDYAMQVAQLIRLNYQAVVLAWNDIQPAEKD
jgi:hypothetical protein